MGEGNKQAMRMYPALRIHAMSQLTSLCYVIEANDSPKKEKLLFPFYR